MKIIIKKLKINFFFFVNETTTNEDDLKWKKCGNDDSTYLCAELLDIVSSFANDGTSELRILMVFVKWLFLKQDG